MSNQASHRAQPLVHAGQPAISRGSRLVDAIRALKLAAVVLSFGSQFAPLGDNGELLEKLAVRVRAARDFGA